METVIELILKVKDVEIKLTPEDARALYEALGKLVGEKKTEWVPYYPVWPYYTYPPWPKIIYTSNGLILTATCQTTSSGR